MEKTLVSKTKKNSWGYCTRKSRKWSLIVFEMSYSMVVSNQGTTWRVLYKKLQRVTPLESLSSVTRKVFQWKETTETRRMCLIILQKISLIKIPLIYLRLHQLLSLERVRLILTCQNYLFHHVFAVAQQQRQEIRSLLDC